MSESLRFQPENEPKDSAVPAAEVQLNESYSGVVIEQFLNQCRHSSLQSGDDLAQFIVSALRDYSDDEWVKSLQDLMLEADDDSYESLRAEDEVYAKIVALLEAGRAKAVKGEPMSMQRKALIQLQDLRAGQVATVEEASSDRILASWHEILGKLS